MEEFPKDMIDKFLQQIEQAIAKLPASACPGLLGTLTRLTPDQWLDAWRGLTYITDGIEQSDPRQPIVCEILERFDPEKLDQWIEQNNVVLRFATSNLIGLRYGATWPN